MDFILSAGRVRGADAERNLQQFSSAVAVNQLGAEKTGGGRVYCAHYRRQPAQKRDRADGGGKKTLRGDGGLYY